MPGAVRGGWGGAGAAACPAAMRWRLSPRSGAALRERRAGRGARLLALPGDAAGEPGPGALPWGRVGQGSSSPKDKIGAVVQLRCVAPSRFTGSLPLRGEAAGLWCRGCPAGPGCALAATHGAGALLGPGLTELPPLGRSTGGTTVHFRCVAWVTS